MQLSERHWQCLGVGVCTVCVCVTEHPGVSIFVSVQLEEHVWTLGAAYCSIDAVQ